MFLFNILKLLHFVGSRNNNFERTRQYDNDLPVVVTVLPGFPVTITARHHRDPSLLFDLDLLELFLLSDDTLYFHIKAFIILIKIEDTIIGPGERFKSRPDGIYCSWDLRQLKNLLFRSRAVFVKVFYMREKEAKRILFS